MTHLKNIDSGLYAIKILLARDRKIMIGRRGVENFPAGEYRYIGSAQKNLEKRITRHRKRVKPKRWHIDYLRAYCRFESFMAYPGEREECGLVRRIIEDSGGIILHRRFGASDCGCDGHLIYLKEAGAE